MIYGLSFNGTPIPVGVKRKFAERRKFDGVWLHLKGTCTSYLECMAMLEQANNGDRIVRFVSRKTAAGLYYGIYVG